MNAPILILSCIVIVLAQTGSFAQVSPEQATRFRTAKTVSLVVDERYKEAPGLKLHQHYENSVLTLFRYAGLSMVQQSDDLNHLMILAEVEGLPLSSYYEGAGTLYTGATLSGTLSFSMPNTATYTCRFTSRIEPPITFFGLKDHLEQLKSPANAPFEKTSEGDGGFIPAIAEVLSQIFGTDFIVKALQDNNPNVQHAAAIHSGYAGHGLLSQAAALLNSDQVSIRRAAAEALGYIDDPGVIQPLISALRDENRGVRGNALVALGMTSDEKVYNLLVDSVRNQSIDAIRALAWFNDLRSVEFLLEFKNSQHPHDEHAIVIDRTLDSLVARRSTQELLSFYASSGPQVRHFLIEPINHKMDKGDIQVDAAPLIDALNSDDRTIKMYSTGCFSYIRDERALGGLLNNLSHKDQPVYFYAKGALIYQGNSAVEPLIDLLNDESISPRIKGRAVEVLAIINDPRAIEPMIRLMEREEGEQDPSAWRILKKDMKEELYAFNHPDCVAPLIRSFSGNKYHDYEIAGYIERIGATAIPELIRALDNPDPMVVGKVIRLLGKLHASEAFDLLIRKLADENLQGSVIWALGELNDVRAVEPLLDVFKKNKKELQFMMNQSLNILTGNHFFYNYKEWYHWWTTNKAKYFEQR